MTDFMFRLLHLSDLHERGSHEAEPWRRRRVLGDAWKKNLDEILRDGPLDFVCFTGDLAFSGSPSEYDAATDFIANLLEHLQLPWGRFFSVPGNHDIQRGVANAAWKSLRQLFPRADPLALSRWVAGTSLLPGAAADDLAAVLSRQSAFRAWLSGAGQRPDLLPQPDLHPHLGFRQTVRLPQLPFPLHLVGLDSAWMCGGDDDAGRLWLTDEQVLRLTSNPRGDTLAGFRLVLVHHPLTDVADGLMSRRLLAERTDLLLRGHLHVPEPQTWADPAARLLHEAATGCLYEGGGADRYPNACQVVTVHCDAAGRPRRYDLWFRSWSPNGHWQSDNSLYPGTKDGRLRWGDSSAMSSRGQRVPPAANSILALLLPPEPFLLVGRKTAVSQLEALVRRGEKVILIRGAGGIGKTTLAIQFLRERKIDLVLDLWMAKDAKDIVSVEGRIVEWLRGAFHEEPAREFAATLDQLRSKLREGSRRIAVLIDNLEPALDGRGMFIAAHRRYVELLRLLSDPAAQSITLITSRERLLEPSVRICDYALLGVSEAAWHEFMEDRHIRVSPKTLSAMHQAYEGSPKAMQILVGAIENDFAANADAYWLSHRSPPTEQELENLIAEQFDRLQQVNPLSYRLLCRLGCYRYQDVSLPVAGVVSLLWETSPADAVRHAKVLQDRALLKFRGDLFWLHPITKAEALARLRQSGEWRQANLAAAAYWTDSIDRISTVEDALHAFEAYYHHLAIGDSADAGEVILRRREGVERDLSLGGEPLDAAFYRLGLLQNLPSAITGIIGQIRPGYSLGKLYDVLGLAYRLLGRITEAFGCHLKIHEIAQSTGSLELQISSLILAGYCKTDLWELSPAVAYFEALEKISADTVFHRYAIMAWAYLAYLRSSAEPFSESEVLLYAKRVESSLGRADLNAWRKAYATLLLGVAYKNLGRDAEARHMLASSIDTALNSSHTQIHARALSYMGSLCAAEGEFGAALAYHEEAISSLEKLAAQCDLAEAHLLAGLTWKTKGEAVKCQEHLARAERLFAAIGAETQVARVKRAAHG